ncbi:MAG: type II toxin-antitoxin system VapC family toxin [Candidatus Woesearchaeota archaeon]
MKYYFDSCILLNLFKKEGDSTKGKPYWEIAKEFIDKAKLSEDTELFYSSFVLREVESKLKDKQIFMKNKEFLEKEAGIAFIEANEEDFSFARKLESEFLYELSFYDCMHIAICKRLSLVLVTRDRNLISFARRYIFAAKPEDLVI